MLLNEFDKLLGDIVKRDGDKSVAVIGCYAAKANYQNCIPDVIVFPCKQESEETYQKHGKIIRIIWSGKPRIQDVPHLFALHDPKMRVASLKSSWDRSRLALYMKKRARELLSEALMYSARGLRILDDNSYYAYYYAAVAATRLAQAAIYARGERVMPSHFYTQVSRTKNGRALLTFMKKELELEGLKERSQDEHAARLLVKRAELLAKLFSEAGSPVTGYLIKEKTRRLLRAKRIVSAGALILYWFSAIREDLAKIYIRDFLPALDRQTTKQVLSEILERFPSVKKLLY